MTPHIRPSAPRSQVFTPETVSVCLWRPSRHRTWLLFWRRRGPPLTPCWGRRSRTHCCCSFPPPGQAPARRCSGGTLCITEGGTRRVRLPGARAPDTTAEGPRPSERPRYATPRAGLGTTVPQRHPCRASARKGPPRPCKNYLRAWNWRRHQAQQVWVLSPFFFFCFVLFFKDIYLCIWLFWVLVAANGIFSCCMKTFFFHLFLLVGG